jgi:hypothetical protein
MKSMLLNTTCDPSECTVHILFNTAVPTTQMIKHHTICNMILMYNEMERTADKVPVVNF